MTKVSAKRVQERNAVNMTRALFEAAGHIVDERGSGRPLRIGDRIQCADRPRSLSASACTRDRRDGFVMLAIVCRWTGDGRQPFSAASGARRTAEAA